MSTSCLISCEGGGKGGREGVGERVREGGEMEVGEGGIEGGGERREEGRKVKAYAYDENRACILVCYSVTHV